MFIMDYHRLNQQLVRETHPLTKICAPIQNLEVFQDVTTLYINMRYSIIRLLPASQDIMTIVNELGKF